MNKIKIKIDEFEIEVDPKAEGVTLPLKLSPHSVKEIQDSLKNKSEDETIAVLHTARLERQYRDFIIKVLEGFGIKVLNKGDK